MEELLPKLLEAGVLGAINILLVFKINPSLNSLKETIATLAAAINKISERQNYSEMEIRNLTSRFDKLENRFENSFRELRDVIERKDKR